MSRAANLAIGVAWAGVGSYSVYLMGQAYASYCDFCPLPPYSIFVDDEEDAAMVARCLQRCAREREANMACRPLLWWRGKQ